MSVPDFNEAIVAFLNTLSLILMMMFIVLFSMAICGVLYSVVAWLFGKGPFVKAKTVETGCAGLEMGTVGDVNCYDAVGGATARNG
jgi:hypothetical protein